MAQAQIVVYTDGKFYTFHRPASFLTAFLTAADAASARAAVTAAGDLVATEAASATSLTPDLSTTQQYSYTALAAGLTINAPTGTPLVDGQELVFRFKDNGTTRALTWNAAYRAIGVTLPTATTVNKTVYVEGRYNTAVSKVDVINVKQEA